MLPGSTISPPNFLTPSRRPALSRPLRDEPPAFLCAIDCLLRRAGRFGLSFCLRRAPRAGSSRSARSALGIDLRDVKHRLMLTMTVFTAVIFPPPFFLHHDLVGAAVLNQSRGPPRAAPQRRAGPPL